MLKWTVSHHGTSHISNTTCGLCLLFYSIFTNREKCDDGVAPEAIWWQRRHSLALPWLLRFWDGGLLDKAAQENRQGYRQAMCTAESENSPSLQQQAWHQQRSELSYFSWDPWMSTDKQRMKGHLWGTGHKTVNRAHAHICTHMSIPVYTHSHACMCVCVFTECWGRGFVLKDL